jgi:hypothetical protein
MYLRCIYEAVCKSGYIIPSVRVIEEQLLGNGVEGLGRGLISGTIPEFACGK